MPVETLIPNTQKPAKPQPVYDITIDGLYFCASPTGKITKPYKVTCKMNQEMVDNGVLATWRNHIGPFIMPHKYPDFVGGKETLAEFHVRKAVCESAPHLVTSNPQLLQGQELINYIENERLPIIHDLYPDDGQLRQAIKECKQDEDSFKKNQERYRLKRKDKVSLERAAKDLNPIDLAAGL